MNRGLRHVPAQNVSNQQSYGMMNQNYYNPPPYEKPYNMDTTTSMPPIDYNMNQPHYQQQRQPMQNNFNPFESNYSYNMPTAEPSNNGRYHQYYAPQQIQHQQRFQLSNTNMQNPDQYQQQSKWSFKNQGSSGAVSRPPDCPQQYNNPRTQNQPGFLQPTTVQTKRLKSTFPNTVKTSTTAKPILKKVEKPPQKSAPSPQQPEKRLAATQFQSQFSVTQSSQKSGDTLSASCKFLAVNVYGIRAWSQVKLNFSIIFELFGILDSRPTTILGGKKFTIKDTQGRSIVCVFYEADRDLRTLMRGRIYRCVGMFKSTQEQLHLVSIREAEGNELQAHKRLAALTCNYLRQLKPC